MNPIEDRAPGHGLKQASVLCREVTEEYFKVHSMSKSKYFAAFLCAVLIVIVVTNSMHTKSKENDYPLDDKPVSTGDKGNAKNILVQNKYPEKK